MSWVDRAACRGMDCEIFFSPPGSGDQVLALATCAGCPVADPLTKPERAEVIRRLRAKGLPDNEIGRRVRLKVERYAPPRRQLQEAS